MPFEPMWQIYQKEGFLAASQTMPPTALETLYLAILALIEQRHYEAADLARDATALAWRTTAPVRAMAGWLAQATWQSACSASRACGVATAGQ